MPSGRLELGAVFIVGVSVVNEETATFPDPSSHQSRTDHECNDVCFNY